MSERDLLARIRADDPGAFEELFTAHYDGMCALAYMLIRSRDAAEDIVSSVFRSLWRRRLEWEPTGPMRSYLLTATRNEAMNVLRQLRRQYGLEERLAREDIVPALSTPAAAPDEAAAAREVTEAIEQAAADLPPQSRAVFMLRWSEGLKQREIADRMGLSIKTVEMHMTRALRSIRDRLRDHR
jgi:RNA polymerase sigma-70 factor (ECF subfamily)